MINGQSYNYNYTGMASNITNQPHGYGRLIHTYNSWFIDGQFKDGGAHGYIRYIR